MKKAYSYILFSFIFLFCYSSCDLEDEYTTSPTVNFESLWKIIDQNYCFFEYKDIDWDEVYQETRENIDEDMGEDNLFSVLARMLENLEDGHVNLFSTYRSSSYDGWYSDDPFIFDWYTIREYYLNGNYSFFDETIYYKAISNGKIGYIYCQKFTESVLEKELDLMFKKFVDCSGIIIDIRDNGGGSLTNSDRLASRFFHRKTLTGYIQHKTGKGHNDFSNPYPIYLEPSHSILWPEDRPIVVLTNRKCYSAANNFVSKMSVLNNVTTIGIRTGGGSGFPFTSELPNGWSVRFSTSPILNINYEHTEFGIEPHILVEKDNDADRDTPSDPILERAITYLLTGE